MGADSLFITSNKCRSCPIQDFCHDKQSESEKFLKTPYSIIGLPKFEIPDLEVIDFPVSIVRDIYRLVEINSKIEGVSFLDFPENKSDKVVEIMKKEQFEKASELNEKISKIKNALRLIEEPKCETTITASQENMNLYGEYMPGPGTIEIDVTSGSDLCVAICNVLRERLDKLESEFQSL